MIETVPEETQTLDLLSKKFKSITLNILREKGKNKDKNKWSSRKYQ